MPARTQTTFGDYLDQLLRKRGLSVRGFAKLVGVDVGSVSSAKRKTVSQERMVAWANALALEGEERERFLDLGALTHAPTYLVQRFHDLVKDNARMKSALAKSRTRAK